MPHFFFPFFFWALWAPYQGACARNFLRTFYLSPPPATFEKKFKKVCTDGGVSSFTDELRAMIERDGCEFLGAIKDCRVIVERNSLRSGAPLPTRFKEACTDGEASGFTTKFSKCTHRFTFECMLEPLRCGRKHHDLHASAVIAKLRDVDHLVPKMHDSVPGTIQTDETQNATKLSADSHDIKVERN